MDVCIYQYICMYMYVYVFCSLSLLIGLCLKSCTGFLLLHASTTRSSFWSLNCSLEIPLNTSWIICESRFPHPRFAPCALLIGLIVLFVGLDCSGPTLGIGCGRSIHLLISPSFFMRFFSPGLPCWEHLCIVIQREALFKCLDIIRCISRFHCNTM